MSQSKSTTEVRVTLPVTVTAKLPQAVAERMSRDDLAASVGEALTIDHLHLPLSAWGEQIGEAVEAECGPALRTADVPPSGEVAVRAEPGLFPPEEEASRG
jgi:hypothetical protein